ncbi:MAG: DUF1206 domain-containing protein [Chloroflexi bacterium]|nr:MAG: DUF1206 domain-containing protein [Chloroflexota bacterium]
MASAHHVARRARAVTKRTAANPWLEVLERAGYVIRGVLYAAMGTFALGLALGVGGVATDQSGSLVILTGGPAGKLLLFAVVIGLSAYSVWGFVRAVFDPLRRGDDPVGIAERLGFAWSGIAYFSIVLFALHLIAGSGSSTAHDGAQEAIATILGYPLGHLAAIGIGIVAIGVGLGQFADAIRAVFKKDLKRSKMNKAEKKIVDGLGRLGMVSRGVTFTLVGWFVLQGGVHRDPSRVHGFGGAFVFLLEEPFGRVLLAAVAAGFIALGLHSFACARWIRLLGSRR